MPQRRFPAKGIPANYEQVDAAMQDALDQVKQEMPDLPPNIDLQPMNALEQALMRGNVGAFTIGPHIRYSQSQLVGQTPEGLEDLVYHELTHTKQHPTTMGALWNMLNPMNPSFDYTQRPDELEAYAAESARRARQGRSEPMGLPLGPAGDIQLPREK